jgi:hypothetical protein
MADVRFVCSDGESVDAVQDFPHAESIPAESKYLPAGIKSI